jgi:hypothetical protein
VQASEKEYDELDKGINNSLFIRASGASHHKSNLYMYLILHGLSVLANKNYNGIIAQIRYSNSEEMVQNFSHATDLVQIIGLQRAFYLLGVKGEDKKQQSLIEKLRDLDVDEEEMVMDCFDFSRDAPWYIVPARAPIAEKKSFISEFNSQLRLKFKEKFTENEFETNLGVHFSCRVYPTFPQLLGSLALLIRLQENSVLAGGEETSKQISGGSIDQSFAPEELAGGSNRPQYTLLHGKQDMGEDFEDGRLTALERESVFSTNKLWNAPIETFRNK